MANIALRRWGTTFLAGMLDNWWLAWRSKKGRADTVLEALACAASRNMAMRPVGRMRQWLSGYGHDADADQLKGWLAVRMREHSARSRATLPARCIGEGRRKPRPSRLAQMGRQM